MPLSSLVDPLYLYLCSSCLYLFSQRTYNLRDLCLSEFLCKIWKIPGSLASNEGMKGRREADEVGEAVEVRRAEPSKSQYEKKGKK
ncbi:hypothetical protein Tco_0840476 [Tanacetum coccineum]|uniref:Uncharacterized protein n=1 Tax=Tanacetum coccineum TaxID=301880 RepID=A0ABQ5AY42_9ASTR